MAGVATAGWLVHAGGAAAFPLIESGTADIAASAPTELGTTEAQDLRHQLQLANGLVPPAGGGWTIVPRIEISEAFNDNILQLDSPRRADLTTYISPGIALAGETSHLRLTVNYNPTLEINAINGSQNAITQQLNALGTLTIVPDRLFLDMRALAGVQPTNGLLGAYGTLGNTGPTTATTGGVGSTTGTGLGLAKDNRTQTMSFGLSPYVVGRIGGYGDYRVGASVDVSHYSNANGFFVLPFSGGNSAETLVTTQEVAHYSSGDYFATVEDALDLNLSQSQTNNDLPGNGPVGSTLFNGNTSSTRQTVSNQVTWHYNHTVALFASLGWENIRYSGSNALNINDATWSIGTTLTPNEDSFLTISYGHQEGQDALNLSARYAATARTVLSASYSSTVGTQLQNLQRQLDLAGTNANGALVNGQTGGALFNANNLLNVQPGVYRFNTFTLGSTTVLDRDSLSVSLGYTRQNGVGRGQFSNTSSEVEYGSGQWIHSLTPAMTLSGAVSYTRQQFTNGGGLAQSVAASAALQYMLTETVSTSARYLFSDRISSLPRQSFYQDVFIVGITKQF